MTSSYHPVVKEISARATRRGEMFQVQGNRALGFANGSGL